ncbi:MAG: type II secretion system protein [Capsulimonadaceae bacterium]
MQTMRRNHNQGFTLIELLVVIAIIAIIASILFPAFSSAEQRSRTISCATNMQQLGVAFLAYAEDNDEKFPTGVTGSHGMGWAGPLIIYSKVAALNRCPVDTTKPPTVVGMAINSYGFNSNLTPANNVGKQVGLPYLNNASKTVLFFEVSGNTFNVNNDATTFDSNGMGTPEPAGVKFETGALIGMDPTFAATYVKNLQSGRHAGGSNFAFCDSHTMWLRPNAVSTGGTAQADDCLTRAAAPASDPLCTSTTGAAGTSVPNDPNYANTAIVGTFSPI